MGNNKGFVTWFLNVSNNVSVDDHVEMVKRHNQGNIEALLNEGYISIFVPCFNESCRVEKTNFVTNNNNDTEEE